MAVGRLVLAALPAEAVRLGEWVASLPAPANMLFRLDVCLAEAFGNVIAYGFDDPAAHRVVIEADRRHDVLQIVVEDDGRPFDPLQVPAPPQPTTLEDAPIGGLGIHLIRTMADEVRYERRGNRNRLLMTFCDRANGPSR